MSTPILPFAVWAPGTNQNSIPANDNSLRNQILNSLVIGVVNAPPGGDADGDIYLVGATPSGAFATFDEHDLAILDSGTWYAFAPVEGIIVNLAGAAVQWDGAAYVAVTTGGGAASIAVQYGADTSSQADSDPGAGLLRWNNATQASATQLFLDDTTDDGVSLTSLWAALDAGGFIYLQHATDQDTWQIWEITGVVDATGYAKLAVSLIANGGSFANADPMLVQIEQGATGGTDRSTVTSVSSASGVVTLNYALGDYFTLTLTENVTSWVISNLPGSGKGFSLMVQITQDSTPRTVSKPGTTAGGAALDVSTGSGDVDLLAISSFNNGTTLRSTIAKDFS